MPPGALRSINLAETKPFLSCLVVKYTGPDVNVAVSSLKGFLLQRARHARAPSARSVTTEIVVVPEPASEESLSADELAGFSYTHSQPPGWALEGIAAALTDVRHELVVIIRRGDYIAITGAAEFREAVQRWLQATPPPPFALVPQFVLEQAFLAGETKSLWLSGTHHRSRRKADTRSSTGINLRDALDPVQDASYALRSGRAALAPSDARTALVGVVGTTPRRSVVWTGPSSSFAEFLQAVLELLVLLANTAAAGATTSALPELAANVASLDGVLGAYEAVPPTPDEVEGQPDVTEEKIAAAHIVDGAIINVDGSSTAAFDFVVGREGSEIGRLAVMPRGSGGAVYFQYATRPTPADPVRFAAVRDAMEVLGTDLAVYYESGHVIREGEVYLYRVPEAPFRNWQFRDFAGFDVSMEKPFNSRSETEIHARCGWPRDRSLFGWVVSAYSAGHLTCDDGAGEVADFVHVATDGTLSLVHVKATHSAASSREVAVGPYEVVVSQASKNLSFLEPTRLIGRLGAPENMRRASWHDGVRCPDRQDILDAIARRSPRDPVVVAIVQPHVTKASYDLATISQGVAGYRLRLLDNLLNGADAMIRQSLGGELLVVGALA